jgi:transposase
MSWTVAIGVDTHKHTHTAAAFDRLGRQLDTLEIEADAGGYARLLAWAAQLGRPAFAIEGAASYGAGLARAAAAAGFAVWECGRPQRSHRRRGKSDLVDAALAAQRLLSGNDLSELRGDGAREQLRILLAERRSAEQARTVVLNQLHALLVSAPDPLRQRLAGHSSERLIAACRSLRVHAASSDSVLRHALRRLARRAQHLVDELAQIDYQLAQILATLAPELTAECGVGPVCAAQLIVSSGTPGRLRSEASFAALAGTSPLPASSGKTIRHRLNRGGDRQLNCALHRIALNRIRHHPETRAYHQRLLERGKTPREARRIIKRALARRFYHILTSNPRLAHA